MKVPQRAKGVLEGLWDGISFPSRALHTLISTVLVAAAMYIVMMWATYPLYMEQLVGAGIYFLDDAVLLLSEYTLASAGMAGLTLTISYSFLTGVLVTNVITQLRFNTDQDVKAAASLVPGLFASGCASCGVGLLSLVGATGFITLLPFSGNLLRLGGVLMMLFFIARIGNPRTCSV